MQLTVILAIVGALLAAETAPAEPLHSVTPRLLLIALMMAAVVALARVVAGTTARSLRRDPGRRAALLARFERLRQVHTGAWLAACGAILYGLGWPQLVRENWHLSGSLLLGECAVLLPVMVPLVLSWWAFGEVDCALRDCALREGLAECFGAAPPRGGRLRGVLLRVRHELGLVLVPLLMVFALQDLINLVAPGLEQSDYAWAAYGPELAAVILGFPWLLRHLWRTEPLTDGPLRRRLREVESRLGVRTREILVWRTGGTVVNAAVAGFLPAVRYVFLSDGLLARMNPDQVSAVYAHELGHVRHRHLSLRLLAVVLPLVMWKAATASFPWQATELAQRLSVCGFSPPAQGGLLTLLAAGLYALLIFASYSRILEQEADLCGCRAADPHGALTSEGAEQFVAALSALSERPAARGWLHPAPFERIAFVRRLAADPAERACFSRRMRRLARLLVGLVLVSSLWPIVVETLVRRGF